MSEQTKTILFDIDNILRKITVEEGQKIAELGCGNFGFFVWPLAKLVGKRGQVYAVDILRSTLEEIKRKALKEIFPQVKTIWSNLEVFKATTIETSSLDGALLVNILHQSDKKIEILRETVRMLKRGGKLLIVEWNNTDAPFGPSPEKRVKLDSLKIAAPKIGLTIKEEFMAGPFHYGLILIKF